MLNIRSDIPDDFLFCEARHVKDVLGSPTLFLLEGRKGPALFVSILLHGNETTGLKAVQQVLTPYAAGEAMHRSLAVFVGNVEAARFGLRRLDEQPDYNRIWPGSVPRDLPEQNMMTRVFEVMAERGVFASVDVHNNTGRNPNYAMVAALDDRTLQLAIIFGRTVVHVLNPTGYQCKAFGALAPSVTLECGFPGAERGIRHAREFLEACLRLSEIPNHAPALHDIDLFEIRAMIRIPDTVRFGFDEERNDLVLRKDIDQLNFFELDRGTSFGISKKGTLPLFVQDNNGADVTDQYFQIDGNDVQLARRVMPSMLTRDLRIIRQDCLCYLMERVTFQSAFGD